MRWLAVPVLLASCWLIGACGGSSPTSSGGTMVRVVTTTTQLTDFVRAVGGSRVKVDGLLKANVDPHDYEATPADLKAIADADVVVRNGIGLEGWFEDTIRSASPEGEIVDASSGVAVHNGDPHIWLDPRNAKVMVANVTKALVKADQSHAADYEANERSYDAQLDALDREIAAQIATLSNKKLVTNHDAFGYYVERYGLEYVGSVIPSFDSQAELSAKDTQDLVAKIKDTGVRAIFSESSLPPKTAQTIAKEAGVKVVEGDDALYGDTLGPAGSGAATYLDMMRHNTRTIVDNLR